MRQWLYTLFIISTLFWVHTLVVLPIYNYRDGTTKNVSAQVLQQPYVDGDNLVVQWSGDIVRSCPVTLRRHIIDSSGYVHTLQPASFPANSPSELGQTTFPVHVVTPQNLPEGESIYRVIEYPVCNYLQQFFPVGVPYPDVVFEVILSEKP